MEVNSWPMTFILNTLLRPSLSPALVLFVLKMHDLYSLLVLQDWASDVTHSVTSQACVLGHRCEP